MRTTLNIDDDVLIAVKELARRECQIVGRRDVKPPASVL